MYPKTIKDNLVYRYNLIDKAKKDIKLQQLLVKYCSEDILFFFNSFLWTYDPRLKVSELPFITYAYQDKYIKAIVDCVNNKEDNITEKSRDMGFSWMILGILLRGFIFHDWDSLIGSYKEDYVDQQGNMDSSFERLRFMLSYLPNWMKGELNIKYMSINKPKLYTEIAGDSGANFGTGGRRKVVFMDEFALRPSDLVAYRKTRDITHCRIIGGTPEGTSNVYGKIMTNHPDYVHIPIKKFRLLWKLHPLKNEERYENEKKHRTKLDLAKEIDISYDDSVTGAVYTHFRKMVNVSYFPYNPDLKLYRSFDFGRDSNVCIWRQKDFRTEALYIINSIKVKDWDIRQFGGLVTGNPMSGFAYSDSHLKFMEDIRQYKRSSGDYGDPYNSDSKTTNATSSIKQQLQEFGIYLRWNNKTTVSERIKKTTLSLDRVRIDSSLVELIQSMVQSKYPQLSEKSQLTKERVLPIHDDNSHYRTAFEYFIDNEPMGFGESIGGEVDYSSKLY